MSAVSDLGLDADLTLDIRSALQAAERLRATLDQATSGQTIRIEADTAGLAAEVTAAVDAADSQVVVTGDATDLTSDVTAAVDAADTEVTVDGDSGPLKQSVKEGLDDGFEEGTSEQQRQAPGKGTAVGGAFAKAFSRSVSAAVKALPDVEVGTDTSQAQREIAGLRDALLRLDNQTVGVDISDDEAIAELGRIQTRLNEIDAGDVSTAVRVDIAAATAALSQVGAQLDRVDGQVASVGAAAGDAAGGVSGLGDVLDDLDVSLIAASGSGVRLRAVFTALGGAGIATGLFQAAQAASDLQESTSKATVVFGEGITTVQEFADVSAESVGLSEAAALEATATFGNLFVALGATKEAATELAPGVVTLAADLASFNNLSVDETLEKLRSGLVGEIEPLRSLGISFGAAEVEAKAMELGLASANGEITEGAKLQARWALILEQSTTAQGDFARTSDGLANQQRILTAEFQNAVTTLGQALLPALLEGVGVAREELIPAFIELGTSVLPALADIFVALLPVAGSFTRLLVSTAPALEAVARAIASVPPELITLLGLLAAFKRVGGSDLFQNLKLGFSDLADPKKGPGGFGVSLKQSVGDMVAANAASIGLSLGLAAIGLAFEESAKEAAEFERSVVQIQTAFGDAFDEGATGVDAFAAAFEDLVEQGDSGVGLLAALGLSAEEFGQIVSKNGADTDAWAEALGTTREELGILGPILDQVNDKINQAAKRQVDAVTASSGLSDEFVDMAVKANTSKEEVLGVTVASTDYTTVLQILTDEQARLAEQIGVTVDETGNLVEATGPAALAADRLALSLAQVTDDSGNLNLELVGLATVAGDARVAEEDLQNVADTLGVSLDDLKGFVESVNDSINQFAEDTVSSLPTIGDIISGLGDEFSAENFVEELEKANEAIANFGENLDVLADFPRLQRIAATQGPEVAAAFADAIRSGNPEIAAAAEEQLAIYDLSLAGIDDKARNEIGPRTAEATGLIGQLATEAFGEHFNPQAEAAAATRGTIASIEDENANMASAGAGLGEAGKQGFKDGIGGMSIEGAGEAELTVKEIQAHQAGAVIAGALFGGGATLGFGTGVSPMPGVGARSADLTIGGISGRAPAAGVAGGVFGGGFTGGTRIGAAGMPTAAVGAANSAIAKVAAKQSAASGAGYSLGTALAQGMQSGINAAAQAAANAAANLVEAAIAAARSKAKTGSPSRLFAELGIDMGEGVAVGLDATAPTVAESAAGLVTSAAAAAAGTLDVAAQGLDVAAGLAPAALAAVTATSAAGGDTTVNVLPGAVVIQSTPGEDQATFERKARGAANAVLAEWTIARRSIDTNARMGG